MNLLRRKVVYPIGPITETSIDQVGTSLRKLQSGKTPGTVIVNHSQPAKVKATHPTMPVNVLGPNATYLIIEGTGGIACAIATKLVQQGACDKGSL
ncbi:hypothetical protein J3458_009576 [Metarhizium acridum]|uniref:uncharacterized protein n=1 Tax=Metarhizium acridum TaxID=92637 RepID=UPI001C6BB717|nr:hypothetical protein J3458_009576 [Metarhizium acridum]